jgi:hypothetical protein
LSTSSVRDDKVADALLRFLYDTYKQARSTKKQALGIREIKRWGKSQGYNDAQIASNITFLLDRGWIKEEVYETSIMTKGAVIKKPSKKYRISDLGMVQFEGFSKYVSIDRYKGININNVNGVVMMGDGNVVNSSFVQTYTHLDSLAYLVAEDKELSNEDKLEIMSDINAIKNLLAKQNPDSGVLKGIYDGLYNKLKDISKYAPILSLIANVLGLKH